MATHAENYILGGGDPLLRVEPYPEWVEKKLTAVRGNERPIAEYYKEVELIREEMIQRGETK